MAICLRDGPKVTTIAIVKILAGMIMIICLRDGLKVMTFTTTVNVMAGGTTEIFLRDGLRGTITLQ